MGSATKGGGRTATGRLSAGACASPSVATTGSTWRPASANGIARFDDLLQSELTELARRHGADAGRAAERIEPIVLTVGDLRHGREQLVGRIAPPHDLRDAEFAARELEPKR
jgi:hypothetical protein